MSSIIIESLPILKTFANPSSWAEWDQNCQYRALHYKFKEQLQWLKDFYPEKLDRLIKTRDDILTGHLDASRARINVTHLQEKIDRITDKYNCVKKEIEGRKLGHFKDRPEHGTTYYIDLNGGNDGANGLGTGTAWLTLGKYTEVTARTPGDEAKVRANTTETLGYRLDHDEDGDPDDWITITGCSSTDDPWGDAVDTKPEITPTAASYWLASGDMFWKYDRMCVVNSGGAYNLNIAGGSHNWYMKDCEIRDNTNLEGVGGSASYNWTWEGCLFDNNTSYNIQQDECKNWKYIDCIIDGGVAGTLIGIYAHSLSTAECIGTAFGQSNAHGTDDIYTSGGAIVELRDCVKSAADISVNSYASAIYEEDSDGTYGAYLETHYEGVVTKDTGVKTGSADFSLRLEPNANCGVNSFLVPGGDSIIKFPFITQCTGGVSKTVTVKIRALGTWGTYPVASELFLEFWYLDHAVNATRTKVVSTEVLNHASNWVSFTVTFTPLQDGLAYGTVKLGKYEDAGDGCYVNFETT